jgi:hypothetical protein
MGRKMSGISIPTRLVLAATVLIGAASFGCSSSSTTSTAGSDAGTASDAGDTPASDAAADAPVANLKAPVLTMVMPMTGGLHVMWTNSQTDCDSIEGERKSVTEAYKVVFTIPDGTVDNKHDAPLAAGTLYTYRVRCKKGSGYSPYSNEMSETP